MGIARFLLKPLSRSNLWAAFFKKILIYFKKAATMLVFISRI